MKQIPNYPLYRNGKPLLAKYPAKITADMIIVATRDRLPCARDMQIGKYIAVGIWHTGNLIARDSRIFDTADDCEAACDTANRNNGYAPVYVEEIKKFSLKK